MAEKEKADVPPDGNAPAAMLEGGTYEIIRNRLTGFGRDLRDRLDKLNSARRDIFGALETTVLATERVTTGHNCVPRDMVAVGSHFIFGYNVHFGLKTETNLEDVFAVYAFRERTFHTETLDLLNDEAFHRDFAELYRYYRHAQFAKFHAVGPNLYLVFHTGKGPGERKVFKWVHRGDTLQYVDARSDHEAKYPSQFDFQWTRTHRDLHESGEHPHISIEDRVFVETVGGDLTVKVENNTESGAGIYSEPVDDVDQALDDAEIYFATVGNLILLKIRPYQEKNFRYLIFNEKTQQCRRVDTIESACVFLPDDHGIIFANGYYLQSGEFKTFENDVQDMVFERRMASPNGEDYLYVFYQKVSGTYVLLPYNLIEQKVDTPIICHGFTLFRDGELVCFKSGEQPQKHHAVQIWQTPYVHEDVVQQTETDSYLAKVGNPDLVRGMAECHELLGLIDKDDAYADLYIDLVKLAGDILDSYYWLEHADAFELAPVLGSVREAASAAVGEFDKVTRVRQETKRKSTEVGGRASDILKALDRKRFETVDDFVKSLSDIRHVRGEIISLKDLRYVDLTMVETLETQIAENTERLSQRCVEFLLRDGALAPYEKRIEEQQAAIPGLTKAAAARDLGEQIAASATELEMLIEIVSNLKIDDATQRTAIIDNISAIFTQVNAARAALKNQTKELLSTEGIAEFGSQMKLLNQSVVNFLDVCDTPDKCEEYLTKVMIQIEELEGRFAEFDEFVVQLSVKRDEIYNAFETRKVGLVEKRNKRATSLAAAADRILKGVKTRVDRLETIDEINSYFATDLMIDKVRDIVEKLGELDDSVKVDDIQSRLKTVREDSIRQLKDRQDLFVGGGDAIKFGNFTFSVNVQPFDLTTVVREGEMLLHLTGTRLFEPIDDPTIIAASDMWQQEVISENTNVYRAEYLAHLILGSLGTPGQPTLAALHAMDDEQRLAVVQKFMGPRYIEGYVKGVHDQDAYKIVTALTEMSSTIGLLKYGPRARALARFYWQYFGDEKTKTLLSAKLAGFGTLSNLFPDTAIQRSYVVELRQLLSAFAGEEGLGDDAMAAEGAEYLFHELCAGNTFAVSARAVRLHEQFLSYVKQNNFDGRLHATLDEVEKHPRAQYSLARDWVGAFLESSVAQDASLPQFKDYADEASLLLLEGAPQKEQIVDGMVEQDIAGLIGSHALIESGNYHLHYNHFVSRLTEFQTQDVPRFVALGDRKRDLLEESREQMRLGEFKPRVLTSFVRNRLLDTVYLPLIGANLAKQIGVVGEKKRTDLMGLLLLVSPPGYGKTTLMEYIANRLGVIFMKINGPAIGHQVTSLDPNEATNAAAREEIMKLNLSLEMGDNVMIYVDDIQHCNPEFLQKFISLCDAQRKIEGVYKGKTRTYDLRGRKVMVVMAGNPYTESGERFQIPDMLTNRADIYNLGEVIGDNADAFELSYLENCLTSNPVLSELASRHQKDVHSIIRLAEHGNQEGVEFEGNYSSEQIEELVATMRKLLRVRDVILTVNREYVRSAAQSDDYRTEPPFKLQGSYRNMNRIAEKVLPIMNDEELESLILSNYENDSQTLTSDTESNMLKFKELAGTLTDEDLARWNDIKRAFTENVKMRGVDADDSVGRVIVQMQSFNESLESIRHAMSAGVASLTERQFEADGVEQQIASVAGQLGQMHGQMDIIGSAIGEALSKLSVPSAASPTVAESTEDVPMPTKNSKGKTAGVEQTVLVMHKVPRSVLDVLRSQFELMNNWLEPLLKSSHEQSDQMEQLQVSLDEVRGNYESLLKQLSKASKSGTGK